MRLPQVSWVGPRSEDKHPHRRSEETQGTPLRAGRREGRGIYKPRRVKRGQQAAEAGGGREGGPQRLMGPTLPTPWLETQAPRQ